MRKIRRKVRTNEGYKMMTLYEHLGKWGTHGRLLIYFTEPPELNKTIIAYRDDENFTNPYRVFIWKIADGMVYVNIA